MSGWSYLHTWTAPHCVKYQWKNQDCEACHK